MSDTAKLVEHLDIWTGAVERKNGAGRGNGGKISLYGVEKLRRFILDLGVNGKLVPQDPNDEPAREHLERHGFRARLSVKELPTGWAEAPLTAFGDFSGGLTPSKNVSRYWGTGYPWVSPKDMRSDTVDQTEDEVTQDALEETALSAVPPGSLLMVARSGILRRKFPVAIANIQCTMNQDMKALVLKPGANGRYLQIMLDGFQPLILTQLVKRGMTVESLIFDDFKKAFWPLPPLAEQKRIVAKVDELMALCDALEAGTREAMAAHEKLVRELLATLVSSTDADDLATNWSRTEAHFDTLFTTEESIEALRRVIHDLAVRGKLIRQNASFDRANQNKLRPDHEAEGFDIRAFRDRAAKFILPRTWTIEPLSRVTSHIVDCPHTTPKWTESGVLCIKSEQIYSGHLDLSNPKYVSEETYQERIERLEPRADDILYKREGGILGVGARVPPETPLCMGQRLMLLRANSSVLPAFLELAINSPWIVDFALEKTTGGAAPRVNMAIVRAYPIPLPPLEEQTLILSLIARLDAICDEARQGLSRASSLITLLPDALTAG